MRNRKVCTGTGTYVPDIVLVESAGYGGVEAGAALRPRGGCLYLHLTHSITSMMTVFNQSPVTAQKTTENGYW